MWKSLQSIRWGPASLCNKNRMYSPENMAIFQGAALLFLNLLWYFCIFSLAPLSRGCIMCPVQETPSVSCWTSARSRWSSTWTATSCRRRNRSSPRPRKKDSADTHANFSPSRVFPAVEPLPHCLSFCCRPGLGSSRRPASCHTSSASSTSGPSLSVTRHLSSLAPLTTSLHSSPVKKSFCPGKPKAWCSSVSPPWRLSVEFTRLHAATGA